MADETEGDLPFLSNGDEEPGRWMAENAANAIPKQPPAPKQRKRRTFNANGPLTPAMLIYLEVMARWDGPMTESAIRELAQMHGGPRTARTVLLALEARGMVDHYRPTAKSLPFAIQWRGIWTITPAGKDALRRATEGGNGR